jgi:hypothetical protein
MLDILCWRDKYIHKYLQIEGCETRMQWHCILRVLLLWIANRNIDVKKHVRLKLQTSLIWNVYWTQPILQVLKWPIYMKSTGHRICWHMF